MIDLGLVLIFVALFSTVAKRSFLNFVWSIRFFFTGLAIILTEQSQGKYELVAITIYVLSILAIIYTLRHIYKGRDQDEDIDSI